MSEIFGQNYAGAYDSLYRAKDYAGEVDLIERILAREGLMGPRRILDLGCGTGNHALMLAQRGHAVHGVDQSAAMLALARSKAVATIGSDRQQPVFHEGDVRTAVVDAQFDAVTMMFAVLCYLHADADVRQALETVRRHLVPGGLFVFDVWNGPAVLADQPKGRVVEINEGSTRIVRKTTTRLDVARHICHVNFDLERIEASGATLATQEEHVVRYFFPDELEEKLRASGLELLRLRSFPDDEAPADAQAWNVVGVARRLP